MFFGFLVLPCARGESGSDSFKSFSIILSFALDDAANSDANSSIVFPEALSVSSVSVASSASS
jgi:hypothetical protein